IVAFDLKTGERRQTFALPIDAGARQSVAGNPNSRYLRVSPDGGILAVARRPAEADAHLALIGVNGDGYRELVRGMGQILGVTWSRDGRYVLFARLKPDNTDTWQIMRVPASGGAPAFTGLEVTGLRLFDLSPDGSRIAFDGISFRIDEPK